MRRPSLPRSARVLLAASVVVPAAMGVAACAGSDSPAAPAGDATLGSGQQIYQDNCAQCHAPDGSGGFGPPLGDVEAKYPTVDDQVALVTGGRNGMPPFGEKLSDDEIRAVVEYTRGVL